MPCSSIQIKDVDFALRNKSMEFHNKCYNTSLQYKNDPCVLVVLSTIFILPSKYTSYCKDLFKVANAHNTIRLHDILPNITIKITTHDQNNTVDDIDNISLILPRLFKGLNVNSIFNGEFGASKQEVNRIFDIF